MAPTALAQRPKLPVAVEKPTPYTFDLGLLMANDANPVVLADAAGASAAATSSVPPIESRLAAVARDGAQALINQLLTTCRIEPTATDGVLLHLPPVQTPLPREKPLPQPRPPTKWEQFAAKKGIKPKTREQRRNLQYNDTTHQWERKWGYGGANKAASTRQEDWVVEIKETPAEEAARAEKGLSYRGDSRRERKERVRRNERKMRKNEMHAAKAGGR